MRHTSHIRVDLNAVADNIRGLRRILPGSTEICSVVKADAYGLGASRVTRTLIEAGSGMLAVFTPAQAAEIEAVSGRTPVLVLMPVAELPRDPALSRMLAAGRLHLVASEPRQVAALTRVRLGRPLPVHVEIDTGMSRGGASPAESAALIESIRSCRSLRLEGVFTHFSSTDPATIERQARRFDGILGSLKRALPDRVRIHTASTGPCIGAAAERRDMVRIGLGWTGALPGDVDGSTAISLGLRGVVSWTSSIIQVRSIAEGGSVGYGSGWTATRPTRLGLVPVGYADGFPSTLVDPADPHRVLVETRDGLRAVPVVGAMNMDQLVVDLGDIDPAEDLVNRRIVLLSEHADSIVGLGRVAARAGVAPHQLLACLGAGVPRIYLADRGLGDADGVAPERFSGDAASIAAG